MPVFGYKNQQIPLVSDTDTASPILGEVTDQLSETTYICYSGISGK